MSNNPLLSVCLITYNHEKYIRQALEGIFMQETNFDYEVIIADDYSTDKTREVILEYQQKFPEQVKLIFQEVNVGPAKNWNDLLHAPKGKYIAYLDGDDYWTNPKKLQNQIDFLEQNTDYSICWTNYTELHNSNEIVHNPWEHLLENKDFYYVDFNNFSTPYCTFTLTAVFKRNAIDFERLPLFKYFKDTSLFCMCLQKGKGAVLNFYGGVYRRHVTGVYTSSTEYSRAFLDYKSYSEILNLIPESRVPNIWNIAKYRKSQMYELKPKTPLNLIIDGVKKLGRRVRAQLR